MPSDEKYTLKEMKLDEISLVDNPANVDATVTLFKRADRTDAGSSGEPNDDPKGISMSDIEKMGEQVEDLKKQVETLTAERDEAQAALAKKAEPDDDVEYVEFGGERFEKSAIPEAVLKTIKAQGAALDEITKQRELEQSIAKAKTELPNLVGSDETKAALYQAAADIDGGVEMLKAADNATAMAMAEHGYTTTHDQTALDELDDLAKKHQAEHGGTYEQAYAEVTKSGRGAELFAKRNTVQ